MTIIRCSLCSRDSDGGRPSHEGCPACIAADDGEIHGDVPPHPRLQLNEQSDPSDPQPVSGGARARPHPRRGLSGGAGGRGVVTRQAVTESNSFLKFGFLVTSHIAIR